MMFAWACRMSGFDPSLDMLLKSIREQARSHS